MKIGVTSLGMRGTPLAETVAALAAFGAECTELNGRPGCHPDLTWEDDADLDRVRRLFDGAGIEITSLGGYCDFAQLDDAALEGEVDRLVAYCQRAEQLGVPVVRAFAGDLKAGYGLPDFEVRIVEGFREVMRRIAGLQVKVGIENHGRLANDGVFLRGIIETIASSQLGMTIDTGNFYWAGHSPERAWRFMGMLAPYTLNVHVKDVAYRESQVVFVPAGRGIVDLPRLLDLLAGSEYDGPVVSEYEGEGAYETGTLESVAYLRGLRDGRA